jgi:hypothetical protein
LRWAHDLVLTWTMDVPNATKLEYSTKVWDELAREARKIVSILD